MDEFPSNSHKAASEKKVLPGSPVPDDTAPEDKHIEPVVTGKVMVRKKTLGRRMREMFFSGDSSSVGGYLLKDVLIPALQNTITDLVTQGIEQVFYGEVRTGRRGGPSRPSGYGSNHISYNDQYRTRPTPATSTQRSSVSTPPYQRPSNPSVYQMGEVTVESRVDAEVVVDRMGDLIEQYGAASVADLNSLLKQSSSYVDHSWGWDSMGGVDIKRDRWGFRIILPEPVKLRP